MATNLSIPDLRGQRWKTRKVRPRLSSRLSSLVRGRSLLVLSASQSIYICIIFSFYCMYFLARLRSAHTHAHTRHWYMTWHGMAWQHFLGTLNAIQTKKALFHWKIRAFPGSRGHSRNPSLSRLFRPTRKGSKGFCQCREIERPKLSSQHIKAPWSLTRRPHFGYPSLPSQ